MLPGNSFAVQDFLPQRFRPGRPARSRLLAAAWLAVPAPGPRLLPLGRPVPALGNGTKQIPARGRSPAPKDAGVCRFALRSIPRRRTCTQKIQFGFLSFPVAFWGVLLQLPLGVAATSRGLNHPTASVPNKTEVCNSTETLLFREPI